MGIRRVALIYDDKDRPETTGVYCRRALESMVDVVHFRANDLAGIPPTAFDLYLNIDDGLEYQLPAGLSRRFTTSHLLATSSRDHGPS
jgi:hypothetical protein